jgi:tight adherence protein C
MNTGGYGALLGLFASLGVLIAVSGLSRSRKPSLLELISPYIPPSNQMRVLHRRQPSQLDLVVALIAPLLPEKSNSRKLEERLARAGRSSVESFRLEQALAVGAGVAVGLFISVIALASGSSPLMVIVLVVLGAVIGALVWDRKLSREIAQRGKRIAQQLPAVAELLAFAVAAGESPVVAIERVSYTMGGELAAEFAYALAEIRGGQSIESALRGVSDRTGNSDVERFIDGVLLAIDRGTPLAEVLRSQAADARAADRRHLLELAGKKDVAMLIPVVFFILPTVVLVALFPGIQGLKLMVS